MGSRSVALLFLSAVPVFSQSSLRCTPSATNLVVHAEGLAEPAGDILLSCSGGVPGTLTTNISITYPVPVTNRLSGPGSPNITVTVDSGTGPTAIAVAPVLMGANVVALNGVAIPVPASGAVAVRIGNVRLAAGLSANPIVASLSTTALSLITATVTVATPVTGLLATYASGGITCVGSPLPATLNFANLFNAGTAFVSTRVTEGFGAAFTPKDAASDTGTRIVVKYSNFPAGARIFVPDYVAGSDATQPTTGGDLGETATGGAYTPSASGSLLLARVIGADANGIGGAPIGVASAIAPGTAFNSVTEVALTGGAGAAVYETIDANPIARENAQFPTFVGFPSGQIQNPVVANESVSLGPVSALSTAAAGAPVPRFSAANPASDCQAVGDCGAAYFPVLTVGSASVQFSASASGMFQTQYVTVNNTGGGYLQFAYSVAYTGAGGWLTVVNQSGTTNHTTLRLDASPGSLAPGVYSATLTIDGGAAGLKVVPISFTVGPPQVSIVSVTNAATLQPGSLVAGSLATVKGQNLSGKVVTVSFAGVPATIVYNDSRQINLQVPASLAALTSAPVTVTVDGVVSAPITVALASIAPGIFGVLNQDNSLNSAGNPAAAGSIVQIFATGLYAGVTPGPVRVGLGTDAISVVYAGGDGSGLQQVNAQLPAAAASGPLPLAVCGVPVSGGQICSPNTVLFIR